MFLKTDGAGNLTFSSDLPTTSFTGATVETSIADSDLVLIYDDSATAVRKMTKANLVAGIGGANTPAFSAKRTGTQSITSDTWTKIQFQTENFDTNSNYDNSTNYRFTPTTSGKYFVYASIGCGAGNVYGNAIRVAIYKNGTEYRQNAVTVWLNDKETYSTPFVGSIVDFNGSSDYVEAFGKYESGVALYFEGDSNSEFGAYKLIGV